MRLLMKALPRILVIILVFFCLCTFPTEADAASVSDLTFTLNPDKNSYTVANCNRSASGELLVPDYYNYKPVTAVGDSAFNQCSLLKYIYLPASIESIGNSAFNYCIGLKGITFGVPGLADSVLNTIGDSAFYNCISLEDFEFPVSLKSIGDSAFYSCEALTSLSFPNTTSITDGVNTIGSSAFGRCANLRNVTLPNSLQTLGSNVFAGCTNLRYYNFDYGYYLGSSSNAYFLYAGPSIPNLTTVEINSSTKHIYSNSFYNYTSLNEISIPDGVRSIGPTAFSHCSGLKFISIPDSVKHVGSSAFTYCTNLTEVNIGDGVEIIGSSAFSNCSKLSRVNWGKNVASVGLNAFYNCQYLYGAYITDLTAWCKVSFSNEEASPLWQSGSYLYLDGSKITNLVIPNDVAFINNFSFSNCAGLKTVAISDSITGIGNCAFQRCSNLTSVIISSAVKNIDEDAFEYCISLREVWYTGTEQNKELISIKNGNGYLTKATWNHGLCTDEHVYACDCDTACDLCGWTRENTTEHVYLADCADVCVLCSYRREPRASHIYDSMCDTVCIFCGVTRIAPHRYSGSCDPKCIGCGVVRTNVAAHTYTNACDVNCNVCLAPRSAPHDYDNDCDTQCNICGKTRTTTHKYIEATCESPETCKSCGKTKGSVLGHSYTHYVSNLDATCTDDGTETAKCDRCEKIDTRVDEDSVKGHDYKSVVTLPTCLDQGYTTYTCYCGDSYLDNYVIPLGHNYVFYKSNYDATCTTDGSEVAMCSRCDAFIIRIVEGSAKGHNYRSVVTLPTCLASGYTVYICSCGDTFIGNYVDALGHNVGQWETTKQATCTESGIKLRRCSTCYNCETELIPPTGHSHKSEVVAPTCTLRGYTNHTCYCGNNYCDTYVNPLGHNMGTWEVTLVATCTDKGAKFRRCNHCDYFETADINAIGHKYTSKVVKPTPTAKGYTLHTCACGNSYKDTVTPALNLSAPKVSISLNASTGKQVLTWKSGGDGITYEIHRATSKSGKYSKVGTAKTATWTDTSASVGKTYYYKVKAVYGDRSSSFSNIVSKAAVCATPDITVTLKKGKPYISWKKVTSAKKYEVYYATSQNGKYKKLTTTTSKSYTHSKASTGSQYFYKVRAVGSKSSYTGSYSAIESCWVTCVAPTVTASNDATNGYPILKWKAVTGAKQYDVYRRVAGKGKYVKIGSTSGKTYTDKSAVANTKYDYQVQTVGKKTQLNSPMSDKDTILCKVAAPVITVKLNAEGKPVISWKAVKGAKSYKVYRSTKATKSYKKLSGGELDVKNGTYTDTTADGGKTYYYKVVAVGSGNESGYSNYKKATAKCSIPALKVKLSSNKPVLSWKKVAGAKKYEIQFSTDGKNFKKLTTTNKTSYTHKASAGTYYYKIKALGSKSSYNGSFSAPIKAVVKK